MVRQKTVKGLQMHQNLLWTYLLHGSVPNKNYSVTILVCSFPKGQRVTHVMKRDETVENFLNKGCFVHHYNV